MKIPNYLNSKISSAYLQQSKAIQQKERRDIQNAPGSHGPKKDEIILSPRANELRLFESAIKAIPEVRPEKVDAVKDQVESNSYKVDGGSIARSIAALLG